MEQYEIKTATGRNVDAIMKLVIAVFDGEQGIPGDMTYIPDELKPQWWYIEENGEVIACVASWRDGEEQHMGRYAVTPALRGQGIGKLLVRKAISDLFERNDVLFMEARDATVHILQTMGAEVSGETFRFFGENETPMVFHREKLIGSEEAVDEVVRPG